MFSHKFSDLRTCRSMWEWMESQNLDYVKTESKNWKYQFLCSFNENLGENVEAKWAFVGIQVLNSYIQSRRGQTKPAKVSIFTKTNEWGPTQGFTFFSFCPQNHRHFGQSFLNLQPRALLLCPINNIWQYGCFWVWDKWLISCPPTLPVTGRRHHQRVGGPYDVDICRD